MTRREMLKTGAVLLGGTTTACTEDTQAAIARYEMPLESAPHERTLMQWPVALGVYGARDLAAVQSVIADIANAIAEFEPVALLAAPGARGLDHARAMLASFYPGRKIVQLDIDALGASGGGIHCATQQQPA